MKQNWMLRLGRGVVLVATGSMVLGTTCARDVRQALVAAGLDFVEGSAGIVLESLFPVEDAFNPE